jgi:hypothetical protein
MAQQTVGHVKLAAQSHRLTSPSRVFCCLFTPQRLARLKREQGQTETNDLEEHSVQSCPIW